ncbi:MAG: primosomal protein N' [Phycisphaerales bacterium]
MSGLFSSQSDAPIEVHLPAGTRFAQIAVERGIERAVLDNRDHDGTLTYRFDPRAAATAGLDVGDRVRVPLGRGNTLAPGVVVALGGVELLAGLAPARVKSIASRSGSGLPAPLVELARWIAHYYICPLGMVLGAMMPAAVKRGVGARRVTLVARAFEPPAASPPGDLLAKLTPGARRAWTRIAALGSGAFPMSPRALSTETREAGASVSAAMIRRLIDAGLLTTSSHVEVRSGPGAWEDPPLPPVARPADSTLPTLTLTPEQQATIDGVVDSLGSFAVHLLRGVTGSGKTEVYLRAIDAALARGGSAIVLVPEIALTPQTAGRFVHRFGRERVAVLHSGLSAAQRHARWAACAAPGSTVRVVVGARSAIFAPLDRLALIVVDEEHDSSYKQDQLPRYHARDVAIKRAQLLSCPIVLGSATPSLESYANALEGRYRLWTLPRRVVGGGRLPRVEIVDLAEERRARASAAGGRDAHLHLLGPRLEAALARTLDAGGQVMLLLNRRGYANYVSCPDARCGWVLHCRDCDATMVFHLGSARPTLPRAPGAPRRPGFVRCHHCLAEQLLPTRCPQCARNTNTFGLGTQRVEEELERKFGATHGLRGPRAADAAGDAPPTLLRVDGDTMSTARDYFSALDRFASGQVRVLVGTQMIAKGLDFPNVRLVGVINADTALALPDFRAAERTFQLVSQVAGRAGRSRDNDAAAPIDPGLVIVQTFDPSAPSIRLAASHDFEAFANQELAHRARAGLPPPPHGRMARIVCRDINHQKALAAAEALHLALAAAAEDLGLANALRVRPPAACPIARIAGQHRIGIELLARGTASPADARGAGKNKKLSGAGILQAVLQRVRAQGLLRSDAHTAVDVDPVALL